MQSEKQIDKTIAWLLLLMAFMTFFFLFNTIYTSSMNYNSEKIHSLFYFTIQTNIMMLFWMIFLSIFILSTGRLLKFTINPNFAAALTTYILITGSIYWAILVPTFYKPEADNVWLFSPSNIWTHTIVPLSGVVLLWFVKRVPSKTSVKKKSLLFFIYPVLYSGLGIYLAINGKYMYPMFNPVMLGGWGFVGLSLVVILAIFTAVYYFLLKFASKI
ncbi:MAG: hypothetical protein ACOC34_00595 [Thermotogota bacterium]